MAHKLELGRSFRPRSIDRSKSQSICDSIAPRGIVNLFIKSDSSNQSLSWWRWTTSWTRLSRKGADGGYGMGRGGKEVEIICYTDDAVIIFFIRGWRQSTRSLYKFELTANEYNTSCSKKSVTRSAGNQSTVNWRYHKRIDQVMTFKYHAANITSNRNLKEKVQA